jgi:phospholipid/cholesterol/gamma-HCH transport system ATP-binding protein
VIDAEASQDDSGQQVAKEILCTDRLTLRFGKQVILEDISIRVPAGQTLAIIGESGCGKTMLLKTLIGLVRPSTGRVLFDGRELANLSDFELTQLRRRYGFVFQNAALFDSMTIGSNVAFPARDSLHTDAVSVRRRVIQRLAEVGLPATVVSKRPGQLSGGMRKRVGLARALMLDPDVVLYDEPTTGLDPIMSDVVNELIKRVRDRYPVTSVVVTHDMTTVRKVADRVIMLYPYPRLAPGESQILFDGAPGELEDFPDRRVRQFVRGEAGERLMEMRIGQAPGDLDTPDVNDYLAG